MRKHARDHPLNSKMDLSYTLYISGRQDRELGAHLNKMNYNGIIVSRVEFYAIKALKPKDFQSTGQFFTKFLLNKLNCFYIKIFSTLAIVFCRQ